MTKRWLGLAIIVVIATASRFASAQISTTPASPVTTTASPVGMQSVASFTLNNGGGQNMDLSITSTCAVTTGMGTFAISSLTNVPPGASLTATYTPSTRGARKCTVNVTNHAGGAALGSFEVAGTGLAPVISISMTGSPAGTFGNVRELDTAAAPTSSRTFTITNNGDTGQNLTINTLGISGTNATDFSKSSSPALPATIAPLASASWTITFNPSAAGARSAMIDVTSNDPSTPSISTAISGNGTDAVIGVSDVAFGTRVLPPLGTALTALTSSSTLTNSTVTNQGTLTASSAVITTSDGNTWFSFGAGLGCTSGATSCSLSGATAPTDKSIPLRCNPPATASGTEMATLTVTSDTDSGGDSTATLMCSATRPDISIDKGSLAFGDVNVNTAATAQVVTVSNGGTGPLSFYVSFGGTDPTMFSASVTGGCGTSSSNLCTVAAGSTAAINVGFMPTSTGVKSATMAINNNDPDSGDNPKNVTLGGNGIAPLIAVTPSPLDIGDVEVGKTSSGFLITAKNNGTADLSISSGAITTTGTPFAVSATTLTASPIAPGASVTWTLTCTPPSMGAKSATFRVTSNSGFTGTSVNTDIPLKCNGLQGILAIAPTTYNFMGVRAGDTVTHDFTLTNSGNITVSNITATLDPTLLGFTITSPASFPISLGGGASTTITVQFHPTDETYGCAVVNATDCMISFKGQWGVTPTLTNTTSTVVLGDGLKADYDTYPAYPNALDLGQVRWDKTTTMPVSVINTGGSKINITGTSISGGTAMAGEFTVSSCTHNGGSVACPTQAAPFLTQTQNDTLVLNITCDPNNRLGMLDALLTVSSDLNTGSPDRVVPLKCTSTGATLALTPSSMVVDFGPTDLDASPVTVSKVITLQNMGSAKLDLDAATTGGPAVARFAFSTTAAQAINPGEKLDVTVSYTPNTERPPNTPDTASITFPLHGELNGPSSVTIQLTGYGADRHIGVGMAPVFPDTFKNPGDAAPIMPITITNTGYAPLDVTAVMLDNDPIWTLVNPDPVVIPATQSHDFLVKFAPLMAGKAPTGHFVVMDNDNEVGKAMVSVDLDGNGLARNVAMGPRVIQLGFTGIGIPIKLSELAPNDPLVVENADPKNPFTIAMIQVDSIMGADGTFEIVDRRGKAPSNLLLMPGDTQAFDITFSPTEIGDFEATASLYLDQDPMPQAQVTLKGRGLYVDAHGGGGCSTGRGGGLGGVLLVLGIVLRKRRRGAVVIGAGVLALVAGSARTSEAQSSRNINLNVFEPTPSTVMTTFHAQSGAVAADGAWSASALLTYANNPLVLDTSQNDDAAVKNRTMLLVGGAYVFAKTFEASARLPVLMQSGDPSGDPTMRFGVTPASGAALGDGTIQVKDAIGERDFAQGMLHYAAALAFTVPTATGGEFAGNRLPTVHALGIASHSMGRLTSIVNFGGVLREHTTFANIHQGPGFVWAAGVSYRVLDQLWAGGELFGDLVPGGRRDMSGSEHLLNTIEGLAGVHYRLARTMELGGALGRGVTDGPGTPALRGLVTFSYLPAAEELKPIRPYRPPAPPTDTDKDGVIDAADDCPQDLEDHDGFRDGDGCPEKDNDNDGVADADDKCPIQAEDRDHFQDEDGCPDTDNDGDAIADAKDKCRDAAEDKDGFQDGDGCPEPDNDKDGILDVVDKCPNEAETINGNADDDGCADKGDAFVVVSPDRLDLLDSIQFSGTRLTKASSNILGQIGATLRAHQEILRIRITAHVQPTHNAKADQKLSEARAKAVRDWLVDWGIDSLRLGTNGFGGEKPLVPPTTKGAQEINDRIELIILERK